MYIFCTEDNQRTQATLELRLNEIKEIHRKLHVVGDNGIRDTTVWRLRPFEGIWADKLNRSCRRVRIIAGADMYFDYEEVRRAFEKCCKYSIKSDDDSSLMHLVRVDAIIADAVDSVGYFWTNWTTVSLLVLLMVSVALFPSRLLKKEVWDHKRRQNGCEIFSQSRRRTYCSIVISALSMVWLKEGNQLILNY